MLEPELDHISSSLDSLLELVLLGNAGNQQLVKAASTFTLLGLDAFKNRLGESHTLEGVS